MRNIVLIPGINQPFAQGEIPGRTSRRIYYNCLLNPSVLNFPGESSLREIPARGKHIIDHD
jgi:hypothetical protein